ncbi:zinc alcohol dehydrogenase [Hypoxylon crocopeplum]|nr:zinc alcohol dehydrogenase [Hypoxylon crocopeplum]
MKAWIAARAGQPKEILELRTNWPTPAPPKTGEVMIRVSYVALNPGDIKLMSMKIPCKKNAIPGMDFVGEVIQAGPPSSTSPPALRVGMIVAGAVPMSNILRGAGVLAEYVVLPAHVAVEKPEGLEESVAAGLLGVAGQTNAVLLRAADLHKGDRVLVNGASGGVGCLSIQVLRGMDVHVTGICSARNEALVRRLGAEEVVDYTAHENLYDFLSMTATSGNRPFDVIIDCVGNEALYHRSPAYLKPAGRFLSIVAGPFGLFQQFKFNHWPVMFGGIPQTFMSLFSKPSGSSAKEVVGFLEKGWIKEVPVDSTFEMSDALQAFEKLETKRAVGKIFVKVK